MATAGDPNIAKMLDWIARSTDRPALKNLHTNAQKRGAREVEDAALKRLWALDGIDEADPLHREFAVMLATYEYCLLEKHEKNIKANYTRRKLKSKGVYECLVDWALSGHETVGFKKLIEIGFPQYTGEAVVLRYADRFPSNVVESARNRLHEHQISDQTALTRI